MFEGSFKGVSRKFQGNFKGLSRMFQFSFRAYPEVNLNLETSSFTQSYSFRYMRVLFYPSLLV